MDRTRVRARVEERADWCYVGPKSRLAHAVSHGTRSSVATGAVSICGADVTFGTGSQKERDKAASLHLCNMCVASALYRGWLEAPKASVPSPQAAPEPAGLSAGGDGQSVLGGLTVEQLCIQDEVLVGLTSVRPVLLREPLYSLPPWRAVAWARIGYCMGLISRAERDGIVREAQLVGGQGQLKPWSKRSPLEAVRGVRGGKI